MTEPAAQAESHPKFRWYQYRLRTLLLPVVVVSVGLSLCYWFYQTQVVPTKMDRAIRAKIASLAGKRPRTATKGQWASAVAWTCNLHANSLVFRAKLEDIRRLQRDLDEKINGDVDMTTILWIWDRYATLTPAGEWYQQLRQVMLDEINQVGPNDDPWGMNVP